MFVPLKNFFSNAKSCPVTIRQFFGNDSALFWLYFIDSQLELSNEYVLKTETTKIAAFEVAKLITELRNKVANREQNTFIPMKACQHFQILSEGRKIQTQNEMKVFYATLNQYLEKWSNSLDGTEIFGWMSLTAVPVWEEHVSPSINYLMERFGKEAINGDIVFDELILLQQFVSVKLPLWTEMNFSSEARWIDVFKTFSQQNQQISQISLLVQYAFAIPGSSTEVERLFSVIKNVWASNKCQMSSETLEAILNVKFNSQLKCSEYFDSIKNDKNFLAKAHMGEKYHADQNSQQPTSSETQQEEIYHSDEDYEEELFYESQ